MSLEPQETQEPGEISDPTLGLEGEPEDLPADDAEQDEVTQVNEEDSDE